MNPAGIDGFTQTDLIDPFERHIGPIFEQGPRGERRFAIRVDSRHVNRRNSIHGGLLMSFADAVLGAAAADFAGDPAVVTLNMQAHFLAPAPEGAIVTVLPELTRRTHTLLFVRGDFRQGEAIVMTAASIWKRVASRPASGSVT
jgi:uncharacterized protein (TIGR00369 family)